MRKNIVLIGFMGCGKTTIGKKLARRKDYEFVDMDEVIVERAGMRITEIFEKFGEAHFRKMEEDLCKELSTAEGLVIATGGGVIKNAENMRLLKENGTVLYIKASPEHIYRNIKNDKSRPLLNCEDKLTRIKELMAERKSLYENGADITAEITGMTSSKAVWYITDILEGENVL